MKIEKGSSINTNLERRNETTKGTTKSKNEKRERRME